MDTTIIMGLVNNAALLMALSIVYEISYIIPAKWKKLMPFLNGLLIGLIALGIMTIPFKLTTGIVFDTRSILIGVAALTFGTVPAIIAACIAIIYRIVIGGDGVYMGVAVVLLSAGIGLFWRHFVLKRTVKIRWLSIYLFGIILHVGMLACTGFLPPLKAAQVLYQISLPVMLIYPAGTVILSLLLMLQKERNESLLKISEAEGQYKSLFDNNLAVMLIVDPDNGNIIDANAAASAFYGWPMQVMKTMNISQINTLSQDEIKIRLDNSITNKKNHFEFQHRKADGSIIDVEVYSGPIDIRGKKSLYSIVHDISKRVLAGEALKESEQRFRLLVESAPDAIFIQTDGKFVFLNQFAILLFGAKSADELIGKSVMDNFHPDSHEVIKERMRQLNNGRKAVPPNEEVFLKMDGTPVDVDVTAVPIQYGEKNGAMVFARDITERKKLENSKNEIEAQLRQQQKLEAIGTLAGGVAHEINNPINGIMNYAQLIFDETDKDTKQCEYAKEIIHETERVSEIVRNLLQFSRQERQTHSYASIYDIVSQTISLINTIIKKDQIVLDVCLDKDLPDIKCRSQQIQQVLMNLLTNARDALNEKYPEYHDDKIIRVSCTQYNDGSRRWLKMIVEDHGNGICEELQEKIFEPFFSTKPKDKGTGLGLSISFGIIKDHHGKISIESKEGQYTRFILDLPVDNGWELS